MQPNVLAKHYSDIVSQKQRHLKTLSDLLHRALTLLHKQENKMSLCLCLDDKSLQSPLEKGPP